MDMKTLFDILGIEWREVSHRERIVSALGAFLGIAAVVLTSRYFLGDEDSYLVIASMGASAVLLFAVPHGALAQPWSVVGGHLVSALLGVTCSLMIPSDLLAAPLAVALAVGAMHYLRCIHPPGGATALVAVIGGSEIEALGYQFVLTPVLANTLAILVTAILFNLFFEWRRYPTWLYQRLAVKKEQLSSESYEAIAHEDFVYALSEINSYIDVSENDLLRIYELATRSRQNRRLSPDELMSGHYYSNGKPGDAWSIRRIIDISSDEAGRDDGIIYRIVEGEGAPSNGSATSAEFTRWCRYEVFREGDNWRRVEDKSG
ncbi:hypothetical protein BOW16_02595 [Solemya velum gill symbiont]|uniref:HPP transmembrane region domain-containing protein n=2 Tax=Solemya velum gill symbiont TaxID=2340 RepID=A0A1T2JZV7_SOVGS|nr:hypothetical protein BOV88_12660 [Solemya velum gill symbiont]OOY45902.1 hypothetical protein BOV93_11955 [Solemya velum gill symbiont]OOY49336.1 hypothetical protein BOV94_11380 [Solemya velum gill symbiont]OOY53245.1 hypothetical protein BOV97_02695 [Solemya velum gill symbiont]OOY57110.1 hypothetical protein BOV99_02470 [Solemya velum gill symbiont]